MQASGVMNFSFFAQLLAYKGQLITLCGMIRALSHI